MCSKTTGARACAGYLGTANYWLEMLTARLRQDDGSENDAAVCSKTTGARACAGYLGTANYWVEILTARLRSG